MQTVPNFSTGKNDIVFEPGDRILTTNSASTVVDVATIPGTSSDMDCHTSDIVLLSCVRDDDKKNKVYEVSEVRGVYMGQKNEKGQRLYVAVQHFIEHGM